MTQSSKGKMVPGLIRGLVLIIFIMAFLSACRGNLNNEEERQFQKKKETAISLMRKQPVPEIDFSMDRYLIFEKLIRFNDPNRMTFCYIFLMNGQVLEMTIIGKMASSTKRLTSPVQEDWLGQTNGHWGIVPAPDEMGVYGESSGEGKLAMTTMGSMLEVGGFFSYIYSEVPLVFTNLQAPIVRFEVKVSEEEKRQFGNKLKELQKTAGR